MTINIGLIGCGRIAQQKHLSILQKLPNAHLAAIAEADAQRASEAQAKAPAAQLFTDYRDLLLDAQVDAVVICLPTALHASAAVDAFEASKDVYLEKPIATSLREADEVVAAWQRAHRVGMIGFAFRADSAYQQLRQHIAEQSVGPLIGVRASFSTQKRSLPAWKQARASGGGVLLDLASHHIDALRFLLNDEVQSVSAALDSHHSEDDNASLTLHMASGLRAQLLCSMTSLEEHRVEVYGERGKLVLDRFHAPGVDVLPSGLSGAQGRRIRRAFNFKRLRFQPNYNQPFVDALHTFAEAVHTRTRSTAPAAALPAAPDLLDGYRSLAVVEAAERSARTGQRTDVPTLPAALLTPTPVTA